jgi:hypothetical protein
MGTRRSLLSCLVLFMLLQLRPSPGLCQGGAPFHIPTYTGTPVMISSGVVTQQILNRQIDIADETRAKSSRDSWSTTRRIDAAPTGVSTRLRAFVEPTMPAKMATSYPSTSQMEARRVFGELLVGYAKLEQQFGIPKHDIAGSVAAFVAGSYMAYRDIDFPDEHFKPLVAQMRQIIGSNPDFAKASNAEKQEMYEQMAILGMFMATTQMALKEKPNPQIAANMRQAAKGYLEQFLKTDADRVQITAQGLVLR